VEVRFTKRPITIEAMQYPGLLDMEARGKVIAWLNENGVEWHQQGDLKIVTLEGEMLVRPGWWIIKGVQGEFYPCSPEIFEATYETADDGPRNDALAIVHAEGDPYLWESGE
jgi:hypothetical protein